MGCRGLVLLAVSLLISKSQSCVRSTYDETSWWQNTIIYEIYPQSFYDSNGDGYGDLKGIAEKASYLAKLNLGAVWLNPIYPSPWKDSGYDISNLTAIDPKFGTMEDFEDMIQTLTYYRCIGVIMDFVPNHTSDEHPWFQKSVKKIDPYTDYYVWKDPKGWKDGEPIPPNNWESIFNFGTPGSAWEWNEERKQFYFHAFGVQQPDLNLRNQFVVTELKEVLKFWMDKGVMGFRVDAVPHLIEASHMRDEPIGHHIYTQNLPETYRLVEDFRRYIDQYSKQNGIEVLFIAECYASLENTNRYYGSSRSPGVHFPYNFHLLTNLNSWTNAYSLERTIRNYLNSLKQDQYPNWVSGNHDWPRIPSRMGGRDGVEIVNFLNLLCPGTSNVYMGDEIGMDSYWDIDRDQCPPEVRYDYRTPSRTPFQWSTENNAGFTTNDRPWIPVNPDYETINVHSQRFRNNDEPTYLNNFIKLSELKTNPTFSNGNTTTYAINDQIFAFMRKYRHNKYLVLINLDNESSEPFKLEDEIPEVNQDSFMYVEVSSVNLADDCPNNSACETKLFSGDWEMPPKSALVLFFYDYSRK